MNSSIIPAFNYVIDTHGIIYCSMGVEFADGLSVTVAFVPQKQGDRVHISTGQRYRKLVFNVHGNPSALRPKTTARLRERLVGLQRKHPKTSEAFLILPYADIVEVWDARKSLELLLNNPEFAFAQPHMHRAVAACETAGISCSSLGIYGGLQTMTAWLTPDSQGLRINDIDLVAYGLDYYEAIRKILYANGSYVNNASPYLSEKNFRATIVTDRWERSCFRLSPYMGCDVRVGRVEADKNTYLERHELFTENRVVAKVHIPSATVMRADESLSVPIAYRIRTPEGEELDVISSYYDFLGVASSGDMVTVKGIRIDDVILLADSDTSKQFLRRAS